MSETTIETKLIDYLQDAHAMERDVLVMLSSMISTTTDPEIKQQLEHHHTETERHRDLMAARLEAHGASNSMRKDMQTVASAMAKGVVDAARSDKPGKNARDGFITEHMEIAAYELLERLATRAGDTETASVARELKGEEPAMAAQIDANWDRFLDLTLQEAGVTA
ncbi:MAG: uncharacterized protein JWM90_2967 [Thermoleophilia bacterium]|nr:uncharacterized protein [Thermoleophilia bacterium]